MGTYTVLLFATLKTLAGSKAVTLDLAEGARVTDLKRSLAARYPGLEVSLGSCLVSVNQEYAFDADLLPAQAEIALFPPVSGGAVGPTICAVSAEELELDGWVAAVTRPTTGAICAFTGVVRGQTLRGAPHETLRLEYEAYTAMAEEKMRQVAQEMRGRWPEVEGIAIVQRVGVLEVGTPSTLIACSAAHRDTGVFEAARYGIDRLKEIVPVWKKEVGPGGEAWVEGDYHPNREESQHAA
jgi:molybdopterin synthase catalytic subunit